MNRRRAILALSALCALLVSAIVAQGASAITGTTAFTCKETGAGGSFTKAHCKGGDAGSGNFSHVAVAQDTSTEVEVSNETTGGARTPLKMKSTIGGVAVTLQAATINQKVASIENKVSASGEHYVRGVDMIAVSEVTVSVPGCKTFSEGNGGTGGGKSGVGTIVLNLLEGTTQGQGHAMKFTPAEGEVLASFVLESCGAFNGSYVVTGSVKCIPDGATCNFTHAETTTANTLKLGAGGAGPKVGIEGSLTFSGRASSQESYTPLSATTVQT